MIKLFRNKHPIILLNYIPRIFGQFYVALVVMTVLKAENNDHYLLYACAIFQGFIWPNLALYFSCRSKDPKWLELRFLMLDSFFVGSWIAYLDFALWPLATFTTAIISACLSVNGAFMGLLSFLACLFGMLVVGLIHGFHFEPHSPLLASILSIVAMFTFSSVMGYLTYLRSKTNKNTRIQLRHALNELDHINKVLHESSSTLKVDTVTQILIDSLLENVFKFDMLTFQAIDNEKKALVYKTIYAPSLPEIKIKELKCTEIPLAKLCLARTVLRDQQYLYINHLEPDSGSDHDKKVHNLIEAQSLLMFPLIIKNKSIGIINLYSKTPLVLEQKTIDTINNYIKQITLIINNAILYEQVKAKRAEIFHKNKQLEAVSKHLARYIPPQLFDKIMHGEADKNVGATKKLLTIFFSDIVSFTEMSDRMDSEKLTIMLNIYIDSMTKIALKHGGTIDKYIGDSIMVFFGDPNTSGEKEDAIKCGLMAIEMRQQLAALEATWKQLGINENLRIRIGMNTGYCAVGNFGSEFRMDYTIIGSAVNLASRLLTAANPDEILISQDTYMLIKEVIACKEYGMVRVKGFAKPVKTYMILEHRSEIDDAEQNRLLQGNS
ncbi:adenylate/guanylate cyclase domain-containing protein [Legionella dresdenensis]|uniref:Adenylate/guanylate cyclase domain-containing protein n=1 Tax=Legionella dresdenensis TaxID=450200 RepID=A0ABV8CG77_9GAMM